jgi:hypothetical protein
VNGPAWCGLAPKEERITLVKGNEPVFHPTTIETGVGPVTVFDPMFRLYWRWLIGKPGDSWRQPDEGFSRKQTAKLLDFVAI